MRACVFYGACIIYTHACMVTMCYDGAMHAHNSSVHICIYTYICVCVLQFNWLWQRELTSNEGGAMWRGGEHKTKNVEKGMDAKNRVAASRWC